MGEAIEAQRAEMTHPKAHRLSVSEASLHCAAGIVHPAGTGHSGINNREQARVVLHPERPHVIWAMT